MRLGAGDLVTIQPVDTDPLILHMQRQVTIERRCDDGYMVRLESTAHDYAVHGPIPESRLLPGWVEENGVQRYDEHGRRMGLAPQRPDPDPEQGEPGRFTVRVRRRAALNTVRHKL